MSGLVILIGEPDLLHGRALVEEFEKDLHETVLAADVMTALAYTKRFAFDGGLLSTEFRPLARRLHFPTVSYGRTEVAGDVVRRLHWRLMGLHPRGDLLEK